MRCFCKNNFMKSQFNLRSCEGSRYLLPTSLTDTSFVTENKGEKRNFLTSVSVVGMGYQARKRIYCRVPHQLGPLTGLGNGSEAILFWGKSLKHLRGNGHKAFCPFLRGSAITIAVLAYCLPERPALAGIAEFKVADSFTDRRSTNC